MKRRLLENVNPKYVEGVTVRRYSIADLLTESYKTLYATDEGTKLRCLVENHIQDLKRNPKDIDRLSEQLCVLKHLVLSEAKGASEDELLVPENYYDTIEGKDSRVVVHPETKTCPCNESSTGIITAKVGDIVVDTKTGREGKVVKTGSSGNDDIIVVDFGRGPRRINAIEDAQVSGRYEIKRDDLEESVDKVYDYLYDPENNSGDWYADMKYILDNPDDVTADNYISTWIDDMKIDTGYTATKEEVLQAIEKIIAKEDSETDDDDVRHDRLLSSKEEKCDEAEDLELTEEELDELEKHLAEIRKNKKDDPKHEPSESCEECGDPKKPVNEEVSSSASECVQEVTAAVEPLVDHWSDFMEEDQLVDIIKDVIHGAYITKYPEMNESLDQYGSCTISAEDLRGLAQVLEDLADGMDDLDKSELPLRANTYGLYPPFLGTSEGYLSLSPHVLSSYLDDDEDESYEESKSYRSLENFRKVSESKAFYKTFKKLDIKLHEGTALTRQESIDLYKAANSALTQLSVELEHNPGFLKAFKESTDRLSTDVNHLRECLSRGKAPSKNLMKSLSEFSTVLLAESVDDRSMTSEEAREYWNKNHTSDPVLANYKSCDDWMADSKENGYIVDPDPDSDDEITEDNDVLSDEDKEILHKSGDKWAKAIADHEERIAQDTYRKDDHGSKKSMKESDDIEDEIAMDPDAEEKPADTEDFVGDDEGDVQSEEADAFDQEYADARVELHKEMDAEYKDSEDPEVAEKLEQDAEEVIDLPGTTEEQAADIQGEEVAPEDSEEDTVDDTEITDDELEELKRHLHEYRQQKIKEDK